MDISIILNIIFGIFGVIGTVAAFFFERRARKLAIEKNRYSWSDIEHGSRFIMDKGIKRFKPKAILTFSGPGSIISNLCLKYSGKYLPIYTVVEFPKESEKSLSPMQGFIKIITEKWLLFMPEIFLEHRNDKILIIHDCAVSGVGLNTVLKRLLDMGFTRENMKIAALISTQAAVDANLAPDFYPYKIENTNFYYPWGKRV